ncbi:MAG TPA: 4Fe-4S dicluster domain-containing protein [Streptosporangiaceae bacterium]|nr:4Fe-4S dicluster domain-containing protein [Streptosporangiaceae bacterium]
MAAPVVLTRDGLDELVAILIADGYQVVGPVLKDRAIVLAELSSGADLASGWAADTAPGSYRLRRREDEAVFSHSAGPQSWKQFLHPAHRKLWSADAEGFHPAEEAVRPLAFIGVRGCDLAAIATLDGVLGRGARPDRSFARRYRGLFVVAAGCTEPGGVCFCASMGTGPEPGPGYDLALTEQIDDRGHRFIADTGTEAGEQVLARIGHRPAAESEASAARAAVAAAADRMGREMPALDLRDLLAASRESPSWTQVAERCLTCGNCTMVCPTCFCTTTEDVSDLTGEHAERWQHWASCFELDYSYLHGGSVRSSGESRYRQWISHKLGTWHDQFGSSGCTGCGRCIAWCPVGIDITEEIATLAALRDEGDSVD